MERLLLQTESKKDMKILAELAKKIGVSVRSISNDDMEDIGLANAMKLGRTNQYIDVEAYLSKLSGQ